MVCEWATYQTRAAFLLLRRKEQKADYDVERYLRFVIRGSIDAPHDTEPHTAFCDLSCAANQLNLVLLYSLLTFTVVSNPSFPFQTSIFVPLDTMLFPFSCGRPCPACAKGPYSLSEMLFFNQQMTPIFILRSIEPWIYHTLFL